MYFLCSTNGPTFWLTQRSLEHSLSIVINAHKYQYTALLVTHIYSILLLCAAASQILLYRQERKVIRTTMTTWAYLIYTTQTLLLSTMPIPHLCIKPQTPQPVSRLCRRYRGHKISDECGRCVVCVVCDVPPSRPYDVCSPPCLTDQTYTYPQLPPVPYAKPHTPDTQSTHSPRP